MFLFIPRQKFHFPTLCQSVKLFPPSSTFVPFVIQSCNNYWQTETIFVQRNYVTCAKKDSFFFFSFFHERSLFNIIDLLYDLFLFPSHFLLDYHFALSKLDESSFPFLSFRVNFAPHYDLQLLSLLDSLCKLRYSLLIVACIFLSFTKFFSTNTSEDTNCINFLHF